MGALRDGRWRSVAWTAAAGLVLSLALALWWAAGGFVFGDAAPAWLTDELIAHRGLHTVGSSERPENSLAAFRAAADAGLAMELDVFMTADGVVVVMHDDQLVRMTGDAAYVTEVDATYVEELRLLDTEEPVPTLSEVLDLVDGATPVIIEIKDQPDLGGVADSIAEELEDYDGEVAVMSFNPFALSEMRRAAPGIPRGQLSGGLEDADLAFYESFLLRSMLMNWSSHPSFVAYELDATPNAATRLQQVMGRTMLVWTAQNADDLDRGRSIADNVICDPGALE